MQEIEQGTPEWYEARKGRITGTKLKDVVGKTPDKLIYEMIAELYETKGNYQSEEMSTGILREQWAIDEYQDKTGQIVKEGGFIEKGEYIGLSPDGLVGEKKAIEVKSPGLQKHIEYIIKNKLPSEYKWQVVHYFVVIDELEEVDFISYNPNLEGKTLHIITIKREDLEEEIEEAKMKIEKFIQKYNQVLSELL